MAKQKFSNFHFYPTASITQEVLGVYKGTQIIPNYLLIGDIFYLPISIVILILKLMQQFGASL
jgi:hypothetical protein